MKKTNKYSIALVAHDNCKKDLAEWVAFNKVKLAKHNLVSTGTTGIMVEEEINKGVLHSSKEYIKVQRLKSGPLGGDQQLGALISDDKIDYLFFFWDAMEQQPHDVDVKALLRIAVMYNIPTASNRSTADYIISSELFENDSYIKKIYNFNAYKNRQIK
ncbi:MAG: methylglyoxal synthase [Bacteroidales bacterium]|nr:methylglyoxal synthase [Bacteroidales bacterium]